MREGFVSRELRARLREMLARRTSRLGGLQQSTVMRVVGGTQLRDVLRVEAPGVSAADVGWSWVAEQQGKLGATVEVKQIERRLPNSQAAVPYWREMSVARSG